MTKDTISKDQIESKIFQIRGKNVMINEDLALLYGVGTKQLKRQVRRNIERFPEDFMLKLTRKEYRNFLRCQIGTLEPGKYSKYLSYPKTQTPDRFP
ncbi:MAG: ORF6N domain-containing protein [Candidatus Omnitrophota bacterium]